MRLCLLVLVVCLAVAVGCSPPAPAPARMVGTPAFSPGAVDAPDLTPAAEADLADDAVVIGVVVKGKARAYALTALSSFQTHIVNDLVGDVPVSVTYCDKQDCARAFTSEARGEPLPLTVGGFANGMLLRDGPTMTKMYRQETGEAMQSTAPPFPYVSFPHERMTWRAWRTRHPQTVVFTGM